MEHSWYKKINNGSDFGPGMYDYYIAGQMKQIRKQIAEARVKNPKPRPTKPADSTIDDITLTTTKSDQHTFVFSSGMHL